MQLDLDNIIFGCIFSFTLGNEWKILKIHTHSGIAEISVETFVVTSQANHVARKKNPMHFKEIRKHPLLVGI